MKGILADINIQGHFNILLHHWQSEVWKGFWEELGLAVHTFKEWGLESTAADSVLWKECQQRQVVFLTANRNDEGPESLEATIRTCNTPESLPVFTLADAKRFLKDKGYAARVAVKLLEYLHDIENYRGAGRLFVP
jgi:hypothetical protein